MGKFRRLSQELWPLIDAKSSFPLSILSIFDRFSSNCGGSGLRLKDGFDVKL